MTTDILALADKLWRGETRTSEFHPVLQSGTLAEICEDVAFVPAFANVTAIRTPDGLVAGRHRQRVRRAGDPRPAPRLD